MSRSFRFPVASWSVAGNSHSLVWIFFLAKGTLVVDMGNSEDMTVHSYNFRDNVFNPVGSSVFIVVFSIFAQSS